MTPQGIYVQMPEGFDRLDRSIFGHDGRRRDAIRKVVRSGDDGVFFQNRAEPGDYRGQGESRDNWRREEKGKEER